MATATNEVDEIRRRMGQIRRELHQDVREVVAGAEAVGDWHRYLRMYPWAAVGVAFATGFLIVPKRRRSVPANLVTKDDLALVREAVEEAKPRSIVEEAPRKSLLAAGFGMIAPMAWRLAQNYAMGYAEQWLAQQQQQFMDAAAPPRPSQPQARQAAAPRPDPGGPGRPGAF